MINPTRPGIYGKNILVLGFGESGKSASLWLAKKGARVKVSESRSRSELDAGAVDSALNAGISLETGGHRVQSFLDSDLIVVSPGVPLEIDPLVRAIERGVPVTGEMELASSFLNRPYIAVTGTNGKSTVVNLIGEMIRGDGKSVFLGGNIGRPLTDYLATGQKEDFVVLEVSSFQLDTARNFSPLVTAILNLSPDHLDRYLDYSSYARSKERIFANQGKGQALVLNDDDPRLARLNPGKGVTVYRYGTGKKQGRNAYLERDGMIVETPKDDMVSFSLENYSLPGEHNRSNLMAAALVARELNISPGAVQRSIDNFRGLAHRIEPAGTVKGISFYDDSKATNIDAAIKSIMSFKGPVILVAGGRHKGSDYFPMVEAVYQRLKGAVFLGEAADLLANAFGERIKSQKASSMDEAVSLAFGQAGEGDVVLLAPACSSFDMFKDFKQRGSAFKEAVRRLRNGTS